MKNGYLYFIKDSYYEEFQHKNILPNKIPNENGELHERPCYYTFKEKDIIWMIPVSSRVEKYKKIYEKKTKNGKDCDTLAFGYVKGNENAFLIQNMIPVTEEYINNIYTNKTDGKPIELNKKIKKELNAKVRKVLRLTRNNIADIVFTPILEIEKKLKENSEAEEIKKDENNKIEIETQQTVEPSSDSDTESTTPESTKQTTEQSTNSTEETVDVVVIEEEIIETIVDPEPQQEVAATTDQATTDYPTTDHPTSDQD